MTTTPKTSVLADEIIAANRRDMAWRSSLKTPPIPAWFRGPHLAGLELDERRRRWDALCRRVNQRRDWVLASMAVDAAILVPVMMFGGTRLLGVGMLGCSVSVLVARQLALHREFKRDARAFAAQRADEG